MTYATIKTWFSSRPWAMRLLLVVAVGIGCFCLGCFLHPRVETVTVTDAKTTDDLKRVTTENAELSEQLTRTQNQLLQLQSMRVTTTHTVKLPGGTVVTDSTTKVDTHEQVASQQQQQATVVVTDQKGSSTVEDKTSDTQSKTVTKPVDIPRFAVSVGYGLSPLRAAGGVVLGTFDARPFQAVPLTLGLWGTVPTTDLTGFVVGLKVGAQW